MSSNRKQVILAACGSLLLHLLLLFAWALAIQRFPAPKHTVETPPPIHLELITAAETPPPATPMPTMTPIPYLDTLSRAMADRPPDDPKFESNQDTRAASLLPPTGDEPLPTQEGKTVPSFAFDTTAYQAGESPAPAPSAPVTAPPPPRPVATPWPPATPVPSRTPVPPGDEFAFATPTPTPEETEPPFDPAFRSPDSTMPERPTVASRTANQSNAAGFQAEQQVAKVSGNITRQGAANVDSAATPVGRYSSLVIRAITVKFTNYLYARSDLVSLGMLRVRFIVDRRGKVSMPRVLSNSANEALASVSIQAVIDAPIPPMPTDAAMLLRGGELPMEITFNPQ